MRALKSSHGEALTYPPGGCVAGRYLKRTFQGREVWCPRCHAAPFRRCVSVEGDHRLTPGGELREGLHPGHLHIARYDRARALGEAALHRNLATLAWTPPPPLPEAPPVASLPLFARVTP